MAIQEGKYIFLKCDKEPSPDTQLCLKNSARIGLCSLNIFKLIYSHRFDILGISDELEKLKKGL